MTLFRLNYVTYSYHGNQAIELAFPYSEDFDAEAELILGFYSTYHKALERKKYYSKIFYLSKLKRLEIYDVNNIDEDSWREGFVTF